jgi:hypothetical protein
VGHICRPSQAAFRRLWFELSTFFHNERIFRKQRWELTSRNTVLGIWFDGLALSIEVGIEHKEFVNRDVPFVGKFCTSIIIDLLRRSQRVSTVDLAWSGIALRIPCPWLAIIGRNKRDNC